jgi:hypothetical protein
MSLHSSQSCGDIRGTPPFQQLGGVLPLISTNCSGKMGCSYAEQEAVVQPLARWTDHVAAPSSTACSPAPKARQGLVANSCD